MVTLNLPATPSELKSIAPYLQRANELKTQQPIIAYWCAYYAAQLGIAIKTKDPSARQFLFELLGSLESVKKEIGPTDAIDDENASSAFVESFALRIFNMADAEDRKGLATIGTAKKFLAAANFLEILSTFGSAAGTSDGVSESTTPEKIRYAKWKAADIAKACREGRKPTPGPAGGEDEEPVEIVAPTINITADPGSPPAHSGSPSSGIYRILSPPHLPLASSQFPLASPSAPPPVDSAYFNPDALSASQDKTQGSWSTAATPGTPNGNRFDPDDVIADGNPTPTPSRRAWVSDDIEGRNSDSDIEEDDSLLRRPGISPVVSSSTPASNSTMSTTPSTTPSSSNFEADEPFDVIIVPPPPSVVPAPVSGELPSGFVPAASLSPTGFVTTTSPPPTLNSQPAPSAITPTQRTAHVARSPSVLAPPQSEPVVLTSAVVTKVQRHCKFAISALDYEDPETARKELRAALAILGG
ncbi:hypothetical protein EUX98_g673 [Antrodiella citrinella]|uniref:Vta1/callose synthase N-terminal domain-containing protein n=1 Tax=Antrodiella citrinella TaxID=2447956 RepID=A0A4S4N3J3_9APHY|nr:hypothetical protein EUX98_g673 [Antrodiella citrinella]